LVVLLNDRTERAEFCGGVVNISLSMKTQKSVSLTSSIASVLPAALLIFGAGIASAETWTGTLNGTTEAWNLGTNWGGTFPNGVDAVAGLNVDWTANKIIQLNQAITVGTMNIGDSSGTSTVTVATGTGTNTLTFDVSTGSAQLTVSGGTVTISAAIALADALDISNTSSLTLSGTISGASAITKTATVGSVTLSGNSTGFSGGITHRQATINLGGSANAVLGTGAFTFANLAAGSGNTLAFNAANSRTIANDFVQDNAAPVPGTQFAQISFSGGVTGNRVQTFTGAFSTGLNYFSGVNPQAIVLEAQGSAATTADEGTIVLQGSWSGYSGGSANATAIRVGANSASDGGSVLIDAANAIAANGGYRIQGNGTTVGTKLILNGAYTMANAVSFAGATGGARSSFGARNAAATTATLSGAVSLSDADGANLFSQNSAATLVVSGQISGTSPLSVNTPYTFTTGNGVNALQTPLGIVELSRLAGNTFTGDTTIEGGTLLATNTSGSATGSGAVTVNSGATLGGTGVIAPTGATGVTVNSGGVIGLVDGAAADLDFNFIGTGSATFASGATFKLELGAPGTSDVIDFAGLADGSSVFFNSNVINFINLGGLAAGTYTLFTFDNASDYTGTLAIGTGLEAFPDSAIVYGTNDIQLTVAVPEPTAAVSLLSGLGLLVAMRRRRNA
jgi:autotransporter-associated beta strand protein